MRIYNAEDWPNHWAFQNVAWLALRGQPPRPCVILSIHTAPHGVARIELWWLRQDGTTWHSNPEEIRQIRAAFRAAAGLDGAE